MMLFNFPNQEFHNFKNGVDISDKTINKWISECLDVMREQIKEGILFPRSYIASGNTLVSCTAYPSEDGTFDIRVVVTKDYFEAGLSSVDMGDIYKEIPKIIKNE